MFDAMDNLIGERMLPAIFKLIETEDGDVYQFD